MPRIGVLSKTLEMLVVVILLTVGIAGCSRGRSSYTGEAIDITDIDQGKQAIARAVARWNTRPERTHEYVEEDYKAYKLLMEPGDYRIQVRPKDSKIIWIRHEDGRLLPGASNY